VPTIRIKGLQLPPQAIQDLLHLVHSQCLNQMEWVITLKDTISIIRINSRRISRLSSLEDHKVGRWWIITQLEIWCQATWLIWQTC
jgi:hypothetical protein